MSGNPTHAETQPEVGASKRGRGERRGVGKSQTGKFSSFSVESTALLMIFDPAGERFGEMGLQEVNALNCCL